MHACMYVCMCAGGNSKLGSIFKADYQGAFVPSWIEFVDQNQLEKVEISNPLGLFFGVKDESELVRDRPRV